MRHYGINTGKDNGYGDRQKDRQMGVSDIHIERERQTETYIHTHKHTHVYIYIYIYIILYTFAYEFRVAFSQEALC